MHVKELYKAYKPSYPWEECNDEEDWLTSNFNLFSKLKTRKGMKTKPMSSHKDI